MSDIISDETTQPVAPVTPEETTEETPVPTPTEETPTEEPAA